MATIIMLIDIRKRKQINTVLFSLEKSSEVGSLGAPKMNYGIKDS